MAVNQLKAGAFLSYISIITHMVVGLIYTPFMLRKLGQSEFGLYSLAASVIAYLTVLDLGFGNALVRYTAKFRSLGDTKKQEEIFGMFLILYSIIGVIAFILGSLLAFNTEALFSTNMSTDEIFKTKVMLWLMTINLSITFPLSIWGSIITAYERFVFSKSIIIIRTIANPMVMVVLLCYGYKAIAMVVVTTIFNIASLIANWVYCKEKLHIKLRFENFDFTFLKEVSIYSFWIFLNIITDRLYWSSGQFVLGIFKGAASIAVFAIAVQLHQMYNSFASAISGVFLPKITAMVTKGKSNNEISDLFIKTGRIQFIIVCFILSGFIIFGKCFINLWAGPGYKDAYLISLCFFIPLTVPLIQNIGIIILQARNEMKFRSILYIFIAILGLLISIPLTIKYDAIGCALGTTFSLILGQIIIMNIYYFKKQHLNIPLFWKEILKMSIIPSCLILISLFIINKGYVNLSTPITFLIGAFIFTIIYIPLFWVFSMNEYERQLFYKPIKRILAKT